jgi:hypothetical protein
MAAIDMLKFARCSDPQAILDNTSPTTRAFDTLGMAYVTLVVYIGATDIAMAALSLTESDALTDANTLNSGTAISGSDFSVSSALPTDAADNTFVLIKVPIRGGRKRYIDATITAGNGSLGSYIASFWIGEPLIAAGTEASQGSGDTLQVAG